MDLVSKDPFIVVGVPVTATREQLRVEMPKAWREFFSRAAEVQGRASSVAIDVTREREHGLYSQLVGVEVFDTDEAAEVPDGMIAVDIPGGQYVHHRHTGSLDGITRAFGQMYEWARENGHSVEEFKLDVGYTPAGTEAAHDLFVRVVDFQMIPESVATEVATSGVGAYGA